MRVAIVSGPYLPVPPARYGGTEVVIDYLIKGLNEAGHEPILLGPKDSTADCEIIPIIDKALFFPLTKRETAAHALRVKSALRTTARKLRKLAPSVDIIHSHGFDLSRFQDFPNVTTLHGIIELEELKFYLKRRHMPYVSISQNQQDACPELNYMGVAYNGEDPDLFPIVTEPDNYVCFLGRFDREKNPHMAIELAINLGMKIKVAGKIDHLGEGYFDEEVKKYFTHPLVEYMGELDFEQKVDLLSHAKINLHPTGFREPFGLTVLEAAYCGTPTLAIARGSMPELIEEGRTGMLVEDFVEGYHDIPKMLEMDRMYIANRARMLFNYKTMTQEYVKIYNKIIESYENRSEAHDFLFRLNPNSAHHSVEPNLT